MSAQGSLLLVAVEIFKGNGSPNFMAGGVVKNQFRIEGTTLWLTQKNTDIRLRIGDRVVPGSGPASETRGKLPGVE